MGAPAVLGPQTFAERASPGTGDAIVFSVSFCFVLRQDLALESSLLSTSNPSAPASLRLGSQVDTQLGDTALCSHLAWSQVAFPAPAPQY